MSIAFYMKMAEELRQLRADNMALRRENETLRSDLHVKTLQCAQLAYHHADFVASIRALVREPT